MDSNNNKITKTSDLPSSKVNPVLEHFAPFFLTASLLYGICFAFSFYRNLMGASYLLVVAATFAVCIFFLQKSELLQKNSISCYAVPIFLLGLSTILSASWFSACFNTLGILLLFAVFMLRQTYSTENWSPAAFLCNILYLALNMIGQVAAPFRNLGKYRKNRQKKENLHPYRKHIIMGICFGIPMLLFVVALLNSADVIFARYVGGGLRFLWKQLLSVPNLVTILVLVLVGFLGIYTFLAALTLNNMPQRTQRIQKHNPITAITFLTMITTVYLIFCVIQLVFLFTGGLLLPEGYTYAQYAHQGFFQLLFLCIFNLVLVLCCLELFAQSRLLKCLLILFSACTYVMIASSALRMLLYIFAYHLTVLRVLVLWFLALLAVLMTGVILQILKPEFPLFRYGMVMVTIFYLMLSFAHVDYWIAKYNVEAFGNELTYEDTAYLCSLSMDAAPVLCELKEEHEHLPKMIQSEYQALDPCPACELDMYFRRIENVTAHLNARTFNLSEYRAKAAADAYFKKP